LPAGFFNSLISNKS